MEEIFKISLVMNIHLDLISCGTTMGEISNGTCENLTCEILYTEPEAETCAVHAMFKRPNNSLHMYV